MAILFVPSGDESGCVHGITWNLKTTDEILVYYYAVLGTPLPNPKRITGIMLYYNILVYVKATNESIALFNNNTMNR